MTLSYITGENRSVYCSINGSKEQEIKTPGTDRNVIRTVCLPVHLKKGNNRIHLGNAGAWCPDVDRITITRL